ncbi:MAG TPA: hypothetical protein VE081_01320 [Sporichthyaceae bacterium]|nr:hypothetical protein [Sporichthyaceae bacterium]
MSPSRRRRAVCAIVASAALLVALVAGRPAGSAQSGDRFTAASAQPAVPDRPAPAASRSHIRSRGPHLVPPAMAKTTSCRLTLPGGVWALDIVAARTLTMLTAVSYRTNRPPARTALAFEHTLTWHDRYVPGPIGSIALLKRKHKNMVPHTWAVDAVLAMYNPHTLFCAQPMRTDLMREPMLTNGLTKRAQTLLFGWWAAYGGRPVGGFDPHGITEGHIEDSAHYDARAVDIAFPTSDPENNRRGWLLAHWLVAQADYYSIATIIFDDHIWSRLHSVEGWRPYTHPSGDTTNPTLRHLDHVHVDVVQGYPEGPPLSVVAEQQQVRTGAEVRPRATAR